ncbi:MAG TPA: hypothetical protein VFV60_03405 [bacterium]|nr:hypothetical protein [bacterium]
MDATKGLRRTPWQLWRRRPDVVESRNPPVPLPEWAATSRPSMKGGSLVHKTEPLPELLFVERAVVADSVSVEVDRPAAVHPRVTGVWRSGEYVRVVKIVETRYEAGERFYRIVTDHGCFDLRRYRRADPRTLRSSVAWEVCAELDAIEALRPT